MKKYNLVMASSDDVYINNLMKYISQNYSNKFNVVSFTEKEYLAEYFYKKNKINILLISPEMYIEDGDYSKIDVILTLLDNGENKLKDFPVINKYQSADKICGEIIKNYESRIDIDSKEENTITKLITYYSPIGGIGKTTVALSTALSLRNKKKRVLYLNLEYIQSIGVFFQYEKGKNNFSDLIYSVKERNENFDKILKDMVIKDSETGIEYFGPVDSVLDIEQLTGEDIRELLDKLINVNIYDYIILDLSSNLYSNYGIIFSKSFEVIFLIGQDEMSSKKVDMALEQIEDTENFIFVMNKFDDKIEKVLPRFVISEAKTIVQTINYESKLKSYYKLSNYNINAQNYMGKIDELVEKNILY